MARPIRHGLLIVFTGKGKGKTTAALGLALRALGHGMRVCLIQFLKGPWKSGELAAAARFRTRLECHVLGRGFTWKSRSRAAHTRAARKAWSFAKTTIAAARHEVVILDEVTYLMKYKMVPTAEIVSALAARPHGLHVVVTGRDAPPELLDAADLVTEMRSVKHPYDSGIEAQPGIEF